MTPWEQVQFNHEEGESKSFEVPGYLNSQTYEVKSDIMYSVLWLVNNEFWISDESIESTLQCIDSDEKRKLWSQYFREAIHSNQITIH